MNNIKALLDYRLKLNDGAGSLFYIMIVNPANGVFLEQTSGSFAITMIGDPPVGGVPEPASWAMLIAGFSLTGTAMRCRRVTAAVA